MFWLGRGPQVGADLACHMLCSDAKSSPLVRLRMVVSDTCGVDALTSAPFFNARRSSVDHAFGQRRALTNKADHECDTCSTILSPEKRSDRQRNTHEASNAVSFVQRRFVVNGVSYCNLAMPRSLRKITLQYRENPTFHTYGTTRFILARSWRQIV